MSLTYSHSVLRSCRDNPVCAGWTVVPPTGHGPAGQAEGPIAVIPTGDRLKVSEGGQEIR